MSDSTTSVTDPRRSIVDRSGVPPADQRREFIFPHFEKFRLENGLQVYLAPVGEVPLVSMELLTPAGAQHDSRPGIARLTAEMLDEGTERHSAMELAERVEDLGGDLSTSSGWNMSSVGVDLLSTHMDAGLELVAETALTPTFPDQEVERLRDEALADLLRRRDQPTALASDVFCRAVYGDSPYGTPILGTSESVERLTRDELQEFYRRLYVPAGSALIVAGSFDPHRVRERIEILFGNWQAPGSPGIEPEDPEIVPRKLDGFEIYLVDRPRASQSVLQMGCVGPPRGQDDYTHLILGNAIFGGKFSSRINLNLRERHGYTYGANSHLQRRRGPGPFFVRTSVATEHLGASAREVFAELDRIRAEPPTDEELRDTKDYVLGVFPTLVQKVSSLMLRLEALAVHRLDDDYYDGYVDRVEQVSAEDVRRAFERYVDPANFVVVAVGPAAELRPQLEQLGEVRDVT
ncbi:MAG: insulinase family protein [Thermoanaerobaculia bacterium]|nr:insulinase family protein [Thermoanaerobaculia bacterium]